MGGVANEKGKDRPSHNDSSVVWLCPRLLLLFFCLALLCDPVSSFVFNRHQKRPYVIMKGEAPMAPQQLISRTSHSYINPARSSGNQHVIAWRTYLHARTTLLGQARLWLSDLPRVSSIWRHGAACPCNHAAAAGAISDKVDLVLAAWES